MEIKLFEIRDSMTFMPMMAVRLRSRDDRERWLLRRAGYADEQITPPLCEMMEPYVIFCKLDGVEAQYDPYNWSSGARTIRSAHAHIIEHWGELQSGAVIDVRYILGETMVPEISEQVTHG